MWSEFISTNTKKLFGLIFSTNSEKNAILKESTVKIGSMPVYVFLKFVSLKHLYHPSVLFTKLVARLG